MKNPEKEQILSEIESTISLPDNEVVGVLWVALKMAADTMNGETECGRERMISLVERFSEEEIKRLLKDESVDSLIFLDPPLETVLADPAGTPDEDSTMRVIGKVRSSRDSDPREALINLGDVLGRICDKHVHSFKTGSGPLDKELLSLTRKILYLFSSATITTWR